MILFLIIYFFLLYARMVEYFGTDRMKKKRIKDETVSIKMVTIYYPPESYYHNSEHIQNIPGMDLFIFIFGTIR